MDAAHRDELAPDHAGRERGGFFHLAEMGEDQPERFVGRVPPDGNRLRRSQTRMGGNVQAASVAAVLPAVIEASEVIGADEAEAETHAAMGAAVGPDMRCAIRIAPDDDLLVEQMGAVRCAGRYAAR